MRAQACLVGKVGQRLIMKPYFTLCNLFWYFQPRRGCWKGGSRSRDSILGYLLPCAIGSCGLGWQTSQRKTGENPRTLANRTLDVDKTTVLLDNLVRNKEPKPCTCSLGCEEGIKDLFFMFGWDTVPCVLDFNRTVLSSV